MVPYNFLTKIRNIFHVNKVTLFEWLPKIAKVKSLIVFIQITAAIKIKNSVGNFLINRVNLL